MVRIHLIMKIVGVAIFPSDAEFSEWNAKYYPRFGSISNVNDNDEEWEEHWWLLRITNK